MMIDVDPLFSRAGVAVLAGAAVALTVWAYRGASPQLGRRALLATTALRTLAIALVALCLLRPRLIHETVLRQRRRCAILLDTSRSMRMTDEGAGRSRLQALRALLAANERLRRRLGLRYDLRVYRFAERAEPLLEGTLEARGDLTDVGEALAAAARHIRGDEAAGILLISDGNHNGPTALDAVVGLLHREQIPVFTIGLGREQPSERHQDVAVRSLDCATRAFLGNRLPVVAQVHYVGPREERTAVVLHEGDRELDRKLVTLGAGAAAEEVVLEYHAQQLGFHKLTVVATPLNGEANTANNRQSAVVRVSSARLVAFYLEGRIRPEFAFIRRSLGAAANIELLAVNAYLAGPQGVAAVLPDPDTWERINVFILGDVAARDIGRDLLARLRTFVSEGGGLLMIGGEQSFAASGYAHTPLADVLPVTLADGHDDAVFTAKPTAAGREHPVTRLAEEPDDCVRAWAGLRALRGSNRVGGVKPAATILLEGPHGRPILIVQDYGRGRSAALTIDTTWRWAFGPKDAGDTHRRFWRQLVLWLARSDYARHQAIAASTDRTRYVVGQRAIVTAVVHPVAPAIAHADIVVAVKRPGGPDRSFRMGRGAGTHRLVLPAPLAAPGEYRLTVQARRANATPDAEPLAADHTVFLVQATDAEADTPVANLALLRRLSHQTGGAFFTAAEAPEAFQRLLRRKPPATLARRSVRPLATSHAALGGLLALFLAALTGDWLIRKRKGLA